MTLKGPSDKPETAKSAAVPHDETPKDDASVVAEVSHELRLPIANIRLLVETLLDGALEDKEVCTRMLKRAFQEVERLQALVSDLLAMEQVSQSRSQLHLESIDFAERAKYAADSVATMAISKGIEVRLDIAPGFRILANREQLDQVLLNLVENAVKFTPQKGSVTISSGSQPGTFSVSDTGIGIPAAEIPKIFSRFYRVDRSASRGSTGLGLSIVKNIAELHGARISVESREGSGSSFKLEFPDPNRSTPIVGGTAGYKQTDRSEGK
jgi:two-component system phosphate regulon sensor histidine kinase PhoR